jgi:hypothetical protein
MRFFRYAILLLVLLISTSLFAQQISSAKQRTELGLNAFMEKGTSAAMKAWFKDSLFEGGREEAFYLEMVEDFNAKYGTPTSYEIMKVYTITPKTQLVVFAVNYSKFQMFGKIQVMHLTTGAWVTTDFKLNSDATAILPIELMKNP